MVVTNPTWKSYPHVLGQGECHGVEWFERASGSCVYAGKSFEYSEA
jgi:hypothetical protein